MGGEGDASALHFSILHSKKYRHALHIWYRCNGIGLCCGLVLFNFTYIIQGYFTGNCLSASESTLKNMANISHWSYKYGYQNNHKARLDKTMCVFHGIYRINRIKTRIQWWRHQMETFPRYWPFVRGIHRSPVNSPHKGQWRRALMFSLICILTNGWVSNRVAGDLNAIVLIITSL